MYKHGLSQTYTYRSYNHMIQRCCNKWHHNYALYGGRGITVCDRWLEPGMGIHNFIEDMGERPEGTELDRINNDLGYFKENCRWATRHINGQNTRTNITNATQVSQIKKRLEELRKDQKLPHGSLVKVAREFDVPATLVRDISNGSQWSNVK